MQPYTPNQLSLIESFITTCNRPTMDDFELRNSIAELALYVAQPQLPQFLLVDPDQHIECGRQLMAKNSGGLVFLPRHLFTINWADTAPGISWPEAYHLTYFPVVNQYVVTASSDSCDVWGFTDIALGCFPRTSTLHQDSRDIVVAWWQMQYETCGQDRWAYVWDEGTIKSKEANRWADCIWPNSQATLRRGS